MSEEQIVFVNNPSIYKNKSLFCFFRVWSFKDIASCFENFLGSERSHFIDGVFDEVVAPLPVITDGPRDSHILWFFEDNAEYVRATVLLHLELHHSLHHSSFGSSCTDCPSLPAAILS